MAEYIGCVFTFLSRTIRNAVLPFENVKSGLVNIQPEAEDAGGKSAADEEHERDVAAWRETKNQEKEDECNGGPHANAARRPGESNVGANSKLKKAKRCYINISSVLKCLSCGNIECSCNRKETVRQNKKRKTIHHNINYQTQTPLGVVPTAS